MNLTAEEAKLNEIYIRLFRTMQKTEEDCARRAAPDLSVSEIHALYKIGIGRSKTMTQVAVGLKISVGALTTAIDKLVKKEYVNRFRVPEDRRIVKIELTESGEKAVLKHMQIRKEMIEQALDLMTKAQQSDFLRSMKLMDRNLRINYVRTARSGRSQNI